MLQRADVICLEDYAKGLLSEEFCQTVISEARAAGKAVLVDPGRVGDWSKYTGATVLTPNRAELEIGGRRGGERPGVAGRRPSLGGVTCDSMH